MNTVLNKTLEHLAKENLKQKIDNIENCPEGAKLVVKGIIDASRTPVELLAAECICGVLMRSYSR